MHSRGKRNAVLPKHAVAHLFGGHEIANGCELIEQRLVMIDPEISVAIVKPKCHEAACPRTFEKPPFPFGVILLSREYRIVVGENGNLHDAVLKGAALHAKTALPAREPFKVEIRQPIIRKLRSNLRL